MNHHECAISELDIFSLPPTQTSIISSRWVEYTPTVSIDNSNAPIIINIPGTHGEYIDLSNIFLYATVSINKTNKELIKEEDAIGPINYLLNTMFSRVDVALNNKSVSSSNETYPYRSYIEALLNYNAESKTTQLRSSLFVKDDVNNMDIVAADKSKTSTNQGFMSRRGAFIQKTCEMYGRMHADIFHVNKFLIDQVDMTLSLTRASDDFVLKGDGDYKLIINDIMLNVRKVKISDQVLVAHALALQRSHALYPMTRVEVESRTVAGGVLSQKFENLVKGPLPKRIVIGLVDSKAYHGNKTKNPFNFQHFNLAELSLSVDGESIPYQPFKFDYDSSKYLMGYYSLFSNINAHGGNDISINEYVSGYNLYVLDLSPDGCDNTDHLNIEKTGNLRLNLRFKKELTSPINVILYLEFDKTLAITKLRNIIYDT